MGSTKSSTSSFEVFEAQKRPKRLGAAEASVGQSNILISEELAQQFGNIRKVVLLYNRQAQEIGLREAGPDESGYKMSCRSVSSSSFYKHFGITARGRFPARVNAFGMLIISLNRSI